MGRKIVIGITILLISGLFTGWYFFTLEAKYFGTSALKAVPENASVIIRINHFKNYATKSLGNPIWKEFSNFPGVISLYKKLSFADSLLNLYSKTSDSFIDNDLTIIFGGKDDHLWSMSMIELSSLSEKRALSDLIEIYFSKKGVSTEKVKQMGAVINCYSWEESGQHHNYCITFCHGLFIAGDDQQNVLKAVSQLESPKVGESSVFEKANKTATDNIEVNIYLNHKNLPQFARHLFTNSFWNKLKGSAPFSEWSEIDLTQKSDELFFNGFSFTGDSLSNYLGIFLHQQPGSFNLARMFPADATFFLSFMMKDNKKFFDDYENILTPDRGIKEYKKSLNEVKSLYGVDIQKIVIDNLDGVAAMVFTRPDSLMPDENKYLILRAGNGNNIEKALIPITVPPVNKRKGDSSKNSSLYKIDKENIFKIYKTPVNDFGKIVFGEIFSDVVTNYFTIYDNCLIMGSSYESLCRYLMANVLQETLGNDQRYRAYTSGLSDRLNFYVWSSPGRSLPFFKGILNKDLYQSIENKLAGFSKIEYVGWQIGVENGMTYNMARLKYNPEINERPTSLVWKSLLGNRVINRPQFVINPSDNNRREIVLQDGDYNFILISSQGRILWKKKLKSPIRSEVFQLDCFKDGKFQYFFSTEESLHIIDHEGNYIQHYPLELRSPATNGVTVVDYDNKKDYRFFIACKDKKIYLYDKKGKMVTGWKPPNTVHNIVQPVQFFRINNKDYIVFTDKNNSYILDRKGKPKVTFKGSLTFSNNRLSLVPGSGKNHARLLATDSRGTILSIGFDGSINKFSAGRFSADHYFMYDDLDQDNKSDYIFLDGDTLTVYDQKANQIFVRGFNHPIGWPPELFTFPDDSRKIGISDITGNKIYLFNSDGKICDGFPLDGNSPFALGFFDRENGQINLISGSADGYLNNYQLK
jgi:hypothetical protein